jgi:hypothetical protein
MIQIIVVRQECDISVSRLYKWALRVAERCVFSAAPGQHKRDDHHETFCLPQATQRSLLESWRVGDLQGG